MAIVLSHPIGLVPMSIFHPDGTMRKTNKVELAHQLEAQADKTAQTAFTTCTRELHTVYIRDAMAIIQMVTGDKFHTFEELAAAYLRYIGIKSRIQGLPGDWRPSSSPWKFLNMADNEQSLAHFLRDYIVQHAPSATQQANLSLQEVSRECDNKV